MSESPSTVKLGKNPKFPTTQWTVIRRVQEGNETDAAAAMEEICRQYWYPVYAFHRHYGFDRSDAEDLTQDFFQACVNRETIQIVRAEKGRLRSLFLSMLREMAAKHLRHRSARKRGGGMEIVALDGMDAEERYGSEPTANADPARLFDRAWAVRLLDSATWRLREDFEKGDNGGEFKLLREFLPLAEGSTPYAEAARRLGIDESTLRLKIHRMRKRWGKHIDAEIAETVTNPDEHKAEREYLLGLIQSV